MYAFWLQLENEQNTKYKIVQVDVSCSVDVFRDSSAVFYWGTPRRNKMCRWQVWIHQVQHDTLSYTLYICIDWEFIPRIILSFINKKTSICWGQLFISCDRVYEWWNWKLNPGTPTSRSQELQSYTYHDVFCSMCLNISIPSQERHEETHV